MVLFETLVIVMAVVTTCIMWALATFPLGDYVLRPILYHFGIGGWYMSRPHQIFWYMLMIIPVILGVIIVIFSQSLIDNYVWLLPVSCVPTAIYLIIGLIVGIRYREPSSILIWPALSFI